MAESLKPLSAVTYNDGLEAAARWHEWQSERMGEYREFANKRHQAFAKAIRALRQPVSDTPDPRDEVIRELRDALKQCLTQIDDMAWVTSEIAWADLRPFNDVLKSARAALSKGEGAK